MRLAFLLTIPSTIGLVMLAEPIMSLLYQHGKYTAYDAAQAAGALRFYALGLSGYAALKVLVNAFYAVDQRKTPMVVSFLAVALNFALNWVFTLKLGGGKRAGFGTSCIATSNFLILYLLMRRHLGALESGAMLRMLGKLVVASGVLAAICWAGLHLFFTDWPTQGLLPKLGGLAVVISVGAARSS